MTKYFESFELSLYPAEVPEYLDGFKIGERVFSGNAEATDVTLDSPEEWGAEMGIEFAVLKDSLVKHIDSLRGVAHV